MKFSSLRKKACTLTVATAMIACYSMVALAGDARISGEITVSGNTDSAVMVNGETVKSGRTVFSSSVISTPADATAIVNVKGLGKLMISPNSTFSVDFGENGISGSLSNGKVTVLSAKDTVNVSVPSGKSADLSAGESVATAQDDDDDSDGGSILPLVLVFSGIVAVAVIYVLTNREDNNGCNRVSPVC